MKLKYYLRGLGIGIVVTVLILGLVPDKSGGSAMTDAQIIARAKELGMVEHKVLSDIVLPETLDESAEPHTQDIEEPDDGDEVQTSEEEPTDVRPEESSVSDGDWQSEGDADSGEETVRVEIVSGDSSDTVCRKLKEAGLVMDEVAYNRFLCENGYDKSILPRTYEIPVGMSESGIAALITGR